MEEFSKKIVGLIEIPQEKISLFQKEIKNTSDFKKEIEGSFQKKRDGNRGNNLRWRSAFGGLRYSR